MFGYLLLLFQLFLGGHFHMSLNGHPSSRNMGELFYARSDLIGTKQGNEIVPLPEWEWHFGKCVFQGNLQRFLQMSPHRRTAEYIRSGASMWKEGASSLVILAIESAMATFLVKTIINLPKDLANDPIDLQTKCPVYEDLKLYCEGNVIQKILNQVCDCCLF